MSKSAIRIMCVIIGIIMVLLIVIPVVLSSQADALTADISPSLGVEGLPPYVIWLFVAAGVVLLALFLLPVFKKIFSKKKPPRNGDQEIQDDSRED